MNKKDRYQKKYELEKKNNIELSDTFAAFVQYTLSNPAALDKVIQDQNEYIEQEIGKVSPFFFRAVEQYRDLILDKYNEGKKAFEKIQGNFDENSLLEFQKAMYHLDIACGKFSELLMSHAREHKNGDMVIDRLEPLYDHLDENIDINNMESILNAISSAFTVMDILLCPETFEELKDVEKNNHYWAYANYFLVEYQLLYQPVLYISDLMRK